MTMSDKGDIKIPTGTNASIRKKLSDRKAFFIYLKQYFRKVLQSQYSK